MHHENHQTSSPKNIKYSLPKLALGVVLISIATWFVFSLMVTRKFEIISTQLVLKSEICQLMTSENIHIKYILGPSAICSITILFRANKIGNGGVMYLAGRQSQIADNQVVSSEIDDIQSLTQAQIEALITLLLSNSIVFGATALLIFQIKKDS
jgi:hypothetical protein